MNCRERFLSALEKQSIDRRPVLCVNSTATKAQLDELKLPLPDVHQKAEPMARLAMGALTILGFEAVRVPFCQTVEAEALGCRVNYRGFIPRTEEKALYKVDDFPQFPDDFLSRGRIPELLHAVRLLRQEVDNEIPILGGIVGPLSIARALLDSVPLLKASVRLPEKLRPFLEVGVRAAGQLAHALIETGVDAIVVEDMTASPDLLRPETYRTLVLEYQRRLIEGLAKPTILHICGDVRLIMEAMARAKATALSVEPKTPTAEIRSTLGNDTVLIGGVDAPALFTSIPSQIRSQALKALEEGIDLLAPGCSIPPNAPTENIRAMVQAALSFGASG